MVFSVISNYFRFGSKIDGRNVENTRAKCKKVSFLFKIKIILNPFYLNYVTPMVIRFIRLRSIIIVDYDKISSRILLDD